MGKKIEDNTQTFIAEKGTDIYNHLQEYREYSWMADESTANATEEKASAMTLIKKHWYTQFCRNQVFSEYQAATPHGTIKVTIKSGRSFQQMAPEIMNALGDQAELLFKDKSIPVGIDDRDVAMLHIAQSQEARDALTVRSGKVSISLGDTEERIPGISYETVWAPQNNFVKKLGTVDKMTRRKWPKEFKKWLVDNLQFAVLIGARV